MKKLFLSLLLVLGLALTQSSSPPFGVRLSALPATTSSPSLSVTGEVVGLPAGVPVTVRLEARYVDPATGKTVSRSQSGRTVYIPPQAALRILRAYWVYHYSGNPVTPVQTHVEYMEYRPGGFQRGSLLSLRNEAEGEPGRMRIVDPGSFAGYDVLTPDNYPPYTNYRDPKFLYLELSRPARVCVIGDVPGLSWPVAGTIRWTAPGNADTLESRAVHCARLEAGRNVLPPPTGMGYNYPVLFAEADGSPSVYPSAGGGLEQPRPNTYCPPWVRDQYRAVSLQDGRSYPTWAPQIDPVWWCYLGAEHGSDPRQMASFARLIAQQQVSIVFGDVEAKANTTLFCTSCHAPLTTPPQKYKGFAFSGTVSDLARAQERQMDWYVVFQMGSSDEKRLCQTHQEYKVYLADSTSGELLASLQFMTDTGVALNASAFDDPSTPGKNEANDTHYKPAKCPQNWRPNLEGEGGRRRIPTVERGGYETWQPTFPSTLGFVGSRAYNTDNPMLVCSASRDPEGKYTCDSMASRDPRYDHGENRWFIHPGADQGLGFGIRAAQALGQGVFYTDPMGLELRKPTDPDAVRQYIKPGLDILHITGERWIPFDPWWVEYRPVPVGGVAFEKWHDLEGALRAPN
ncbi:MAG: hypothetical protein ACOYW9_09930 [Deinococcota bacterium]